MLDLNMPIVDGLDFLDYYQKFLHNDSKTKIVISSSGAHEYDLRKIDEYPFVIDCIHKPLTLEQVEDLYNLLNTGESYKAAHRKTSVFDTPNTDHIVWNTQYGHHEPVLRAWLLHANDPDCISGIGDAKNYRAITRLIDPGNTAYVRYKNEIHLLEDLKAEEGQPHDIKRLVFLPTELMYLDIHKFLTELMNLNNRRYIEARVLIQRQYLTEPMLKELFRYDFVCGTFLQPKELP